MLLRQEFVHVVGFQHEEEFEADCLEVLEPNYSESAELNGVESLVLDDSETPEWGGADARERDEQSLVLEDLETLGQDDAEFHEAELLV